MPGLAARIAALPEEERVFLLRAYPEQEAAAGEAGRLGRLLIDPGWLEAQRRFDPSLQTYLEGLGIAIRAVEAGQAGERGLLLLMVLSLLASTARSILGELPDAALQVMSQDGRIEQARYSAGQHGSPWERCEAFLVVARVEIGLGRRNGAAETLAMALREASAVPNPGWRCRALLAVRQVQQTNAPDRSRFAAELGQICDLAETIPDLALKTHVLAELAAAAGAAGLAGLRQRAATGVQKTYAAAAESVRQRQLDHRRRARDKAPFSFEPMKAEPLDYLVRQIDLLGLWNQPDYLVEVAREDARVAGQAAAIPFSLAGPAGIVARVMRAATRLGDKATCDRLAALLLQPSGSAARVADLSTPGDRVELVEALGEAGCGEAAVALIARELAETPDVAGLRKALARGAGRRGDLKSIEAAAGQIVPAGQPGSLGDRIARAAQGAEQRVKVKGAGWLLGAGVSGAEVERIEVYLEGYRGLLEHDAAQAEAFLNALCRQAGPKGESLIRRIQAAGPGGLDDIANERLDKLLGAIERLPGSHLAVSPDDRVDMHLARNGFDAALAVLVEVKEPAERVRLQYQIVRGMLQAGQLERGLSLAEILPAGTERRHLFQEAMAHLAAGPGPESAGLADRITTGLGELADDDRLARSPALPALAAALLERVPLAVARPLLESLGPDAFVVTLEPLAAAAARVEPSQQAAEAVRSLLGRIEGQPPSMQRLKAACALVRACGRDGRLAAECRRAYRLALEDTRRLDFKSPPRYDLSFEEVRKRKARERTPLAELAGAARALGDRAVLLDLWDLAQRIITNGPRGAEDGALVDIAAGLAAAGEVMRYDHWGSFPLLNAIGHAYKPLAQLEMAAAMKKLPAAAAYGSRGRRTLSAAGDWVSAKLEEKLDDANEKPVGSWKSYKGQWAAEQIEQTREGLIWNALRDLPELPSAPTTTVRLGAGLEQPHFLRAGLLSGRAAGDARLWSRMVSSLAGQKLYAAIPRAVLAAQRSLLTDEEARTSFFDSPAGVTQEELDAIADLAMAALLEANQVELGQQLAALLPEDAPGIRARLAAASGPREAARMLDRALREPWHPITVAAVASAASRLPDPTARRALAFQILQKARGEQRAGVLAALGAMIPLAASILSSGDLADALTRIVASESCW